MKDTADIIALPPVIFGGFLAAGIAANQVWPVPLPTAGLWHWVGIMLIVSSLVLAGSAVRAMKRAKTDVSPHRPTTVVVCDGPFRHTRNPLYISLVMIFIGTSACLDSLTMLVLAIPFAITLDRGVIVPEEHYLERKFGDGYRNYRNTVRRWL